VIKQKQTQTMAGTRDFRTGQRCTPLAASVGPDLHGDGTWPGDDQAGSAGPPPGFEPSDPDGIPDPVVPPTDPAYIDEVSEGPPVGFEEPDPDAPPPPVIEPTDPLYQGPVAETPPGFEEPEAPWEPGGEKPEEPPPPETFGATLADDRVEKDRPLV